MATNEAIAGSTSISFFENSEIRYAGIQVSDLLAQSSFEEVIFLLWNRRLPRSAELNALREELWSHQSLSAEIKAIFASLPHTVDFLDSLRSGLSILGSADSKDSIRLVAQFPALVVNLWRHTHGLPEVEARSRDSIPAHFLELLRGKKASTEEVRALDQAMMVYADNEFNISTFCARLAASTNANLYACVSSAFSAFQGPLHGGANERVMEMLEKIAESQSVREFLESALARKEKIWGIGHLIYKSGDPRSPLMKEICKTLSRSKGDERWLKISEEVETFMIAKKSLRPNIDFYAASIFKLLDIPTKLFPAVFAMSRLPGWIAHSLEQMGNSKILMPRAEYTGDRSAKFIPIDQRH